jgi:hypothetical protein
MECDDPQELRMKFCLDDGVGEGEGGQRKNISAETGASEPALPFVTISSSAKVLEYLYPISLFNCYLVAHSFWMTLLSVRPIAER